MFNAVIPTPHYLPYANASSPINCKTADPSGKGRAAIGVTVCGSGTLVVRPCGGPIDGSLDRTEQFIAGMTKWIEFDQIISGTATNFTAYWQRA